MMFVNSDFSDLLKIFNDHNVKYLVVGGYAVIQYGEPRLTKDLDVWVSTKKTNASRVYKALKAFGAPLSDLTEQDFSEDGTFYQMGIPPLRVDVLMGLPGVNFDKAWNQRVEVDFDGLIVPFISRQDLITLKRTSGRLQDAIDADQLSSVEDG